MHCSASSPRHIINTVLAPPASCQNQPAQCSCSPPSSPAMPLYSLSLIVLIHFYIYFEVHQVTNGHLTRSIYFIPCFPATITLSIFFLLFSTTDSHSKHNQLSTSARLSQARQHFPSCFIVTRLLTTFTTAIKSKLHTLTERLSFFLSSSATFHPIHFDNNNKESEHVIQVSRIIYAQTCLACHPLP